MKKTILISVIGYLITSLSINSYAGEKPASYKKGKKLYKAHCLACHQSKGQGIPGAFPPLADSDYLMADMQRAISIPLKGLTGKITVNGQDYNSTMPSFAHLQDQDIAAVMTYVTNAWGNEGAEISSDEVKQAR